MSSEIKANTISEVTSANGVTIDGVSLKDGQVPASAGASMVFISKGEGTGSNAVIEFTGLDSTYISYKFFIHHASPTGSTEKNFYALIGTSSAYLTGSTAYLLGVTETRPTMHQANTISGQAVFMYDVGSGEATSAGFNGEVTLINPSSTARATPIIWECVSVMANDTLVAYHGYSTSNEEIGAITRIKFYWESDVNFSDTSVISMYGIKNG